MKKNVFKFRRLKWGDPEEKFKMLPEDTSPPGSRRDAHPGASTILTDRTFIGVAIVLIVLAAALSLL